MQPVTFYPVSSGSSDSSSSNVVGELTSAVGDLASASAEALGSLASSGVSALGDAAATGVSSLVVEPIKGATNLIRSSFTPSASASVKSSDVFPGSQSVKASDVFPTSPRGFQFAPPEGLTTPNQTGIWPSSHPSNYMSGSPYPMDLSSQSAAIQSVQQMAQQLAVQSLMPSTQLLTPPSATSSRLSSSLTSESVFPQSPNQIVALLIRINHQEYLIYQYLRILH